MSNTKSHIVHKLSPILVVGSSLTKIYNIRADVYIFEGIATNSCLLNTATRGYVPICSEGRRRRTRVLSLYLNRVTRRIPLFVRSTSTDDHSLRGSYQSLRDFPAPPVDKKTQITKNKFLFLKSLCKSSSCHIPTPHSKWPALDRR